MRAAGPSRPTGRRIANALRLLGRTARAHGPRGVLALLRYYAARVQARVGPGRLCPICGWAGPNFQPLLLLEDAYVRRGAVCPQCLSRERQRAFAPLIPAILEKHFGRRVIDVLEFAPDRSITPQLRPFARTYRASNYVERAPGELQLDLQDIALPADDVDLVVLSYVLCCIPDDRAATSHLWRIVRPGGMVLACEAFDTSGRHVEYGEPRQGGTWRQYGLSDVGDRFAPFDVNVVNLTESLSEADRILRGVRHPEFAIVMRKPPSAPVGTSCA